LTAVKKAAPAGKKSGGTKRAAPAARKASTTRARPPAAKKAASGKRVGSAKKSAGGAKKPARSTKTAPSRAKATKKGAAPAKRSAPPSKAAARPAKKSAPAAKAPASTRKAAAGAKAGTERAPAARAAKKPPSLGPYAKEHKFLEEQAALLLAERAVYEGQAHDLRAEADSLALEREPGDVQFDEESGEGGTVTVDRERNLALSAQAGAAVEEIDDALRKIERKTYGTCERCHHAIPKARLRALPYARLCVACKSGGLSRR
jgi:RNA polymerase-binding transcription factor DksA